MKLLTFQAINLCILSVPPDGICVKLQQSLNTVWTVKKKQPHNSLTNWKNCCVNWTQRQMIFNMYDRFYTYGNTYTSITSSFQKEENTVSCHLYLFISFLCYCFFPWELKSSEITRSLTVCCFIPLSFRLFWNISPQIAHQYADNR